jgi:hypothetical protein
MKKEKIKDIFVFIFLISSLVSAIYLGFIWGPSHQHIITKEHTIIDKYIDVSAGFTHYNLLFEDNSSAWVSFYKYRSLNIGNHYNVTDVVWIW